MKYLTLFILLSLGALIISCDSRDQNGTLPISPLADLLVPTLITAIDSGEGAIEIALRRPDYNNSTLTTLTELKQTLDLLKTITQRIELRQADATIIAQLHQYAEAINTRRGLLQSDIIGLKSTNLAAAIQLGVVNELTEFCQLTAEDISNALSGNTFIE